VWHLYVKELSKCPAAREHIRSTVVPELSATLANRVAEYERKRKEGLLASRGGWDAESLAIAEAQRILRKSVVFFSRSNFPL
jgi:hypothetical protein